MKQVPVWAFKTKFIKTNKSKTTRNLAFNDILISNIILLPFEVDVILIFSKALFV